MKEADRLTVHRKTELSMKYAHLNDLLKNINEINSRITDLNTEINKLHSKKNRLDEEFHKEVIKVEPTEICSIKTKQKPQIDKEQQKKLIEAAKKDPAILEQVCNLLGVDYVVVTESH